MVAFPEAQVLDIAGPCEVLAQAYLPDDAPAYAAQLVSRERDLLPTIGGLKIVVCRSFLGLTPVERNRIDTLLVAGSDGLVMPSLRGASRCGNSERPAVSHFAFGLIAWRSSSQSG